MNRAAILALALIAAGCTEEPAAPPAERGGEAAGEVLGGTISDAMIPLEQLRSEAPLMPRESAAPGAADDAADAADEPGADADAAGSDGAEAAPAAPAPDTAAD